MIRFLILFYLLLSSLPTAASVTVNVGGYLFPPFVELSAEDEPSGLAIDLLALLNAAQAQYHFHFVMTTSKRRYSDFDHHKFDFMLFENPQWGWQGRPVERSETFLHGGEVYLAHAEAGRDQSFFDNLQNKRMVGVLGYHYGFAGFNADEEYLRQHFNMYLTSSHLGVIRSILLAKPNIPDVAVVTKSYLDHYLKEHPEDRSKLLISNRYDQHYEHAVLVRQGVHPDVSEINQWLRELRDSGKLQSLWDAYGIQN